MQHHILRPRQALNKAYLRLKASRAGIETFKQSLRLLLDSINLNESEEHAKHHLRDFLQSLFYVKYGVSTKGNTGLVIHTGPITKTKAGVLLEVKRPTNKADMPSPENLNAKAVHELLLYSNSPEEVAALEVLYHLLSPAYLLKEAFIAEQQGENSSPVCFANVHGLREGF